MKQYILPSLKLTVVMIILCAVIYPLLISAIAILSPGKGKGVTVQANGRVVGYALIGQKFTDDKYFWGRPSTVDYNAAGSAGSNKAASNPDYIKTIQERIDSFLVHNPTVRKNEIPAEMITASGSGLDPDISVRSAMIQVNRIASFRNIPGEKLMALIHGHIEKPLAGILGPAKINVLKLNIALDKLR